MSFAQEYGAGHVDGFGIVVGIQNMVGSWSLFRNESAWARFEFAVLDDCEADAADIERGVIDSDSLADRCGIVGVGKVACLCALDMFDIISRGEVSAVMACTCVGFFAGLAPQVCLSRIVVVGD